MSIIAKVAERRVSHVVLGRIQVKSSDLRQRGCPQSSRSKCLPVYVNNEN